MQTVFTAVFVTAAIGFAGKIGSAPQLSASDARMTAQCAKQAMQQYEDALALQHSLVRSGNSLPAGSGEALLALRKAASNEDCGAIHST